MTARASIFEQTILPLFEETREDWLKRARAKAIELAAAQGEITIDDVREVCPPPDGVDGRVMGAVFHPRANWKCTGYRRSERAECHNRPVAVHRYVGMAG